MPTFIPAFPQDKGPLVMVDVYHNNFGVKEGNYDPLFTLLKKDGYRVKFIAEELSMQTLRQGDVLVIINAIESRNIEKWALPVYEAISERETDNIYKWVEAGGSFLLVSDHMPFPAATESLASRFGVRFSNGFAIDTVSWDPLIFKRTDSTLLKHPVSLGRNKMEEIDSVETFWGQAFQLNSNQMTGIFRFTDNTVSYNPDTAWRFYKETLVIPVKNWYQAAAGKFEKGRVIILGEAGMLTAQVTGANRVKMGMNSKKAKQNFQFILNAFHWLSHLFTG